MALYERILVPLDGSQVAERALDQAVEIAGQFKSALILVRVLPPPDAAPALPDSLDVPWPEETAFQEKVQGWEGERRAAEEYLSSVRDRLRREGLEAEAQVVSGDAAEQILGCAKEERASLILMSTHGQGGFRRGELGRTANAVLKGSAIPLLVIPYR